MWLIQKEGDFRPRSVCGGFVVVCFLLVMVVGFLLAFLIKFPIFLKGFAAVLLMLKGFF